VATMPWPRIMLYDSKISTTASKVHKSCLQEFDLIHII
jgi:hypothetical protein